MIKSALQTILVLSTLTLNSFALPTGEPVSSDLDKRQAATTRNDITNNVACRAVTVIFARGTGEAGNVGSIAGPPFFSALSSLIGANNLAVQGVNYAASIPGYLEGGDPAGASNMAGFAATIAGRCPSTQIVLSGYSQGAQEVHLAAKQLSTATAAKVKAVVLFGDPDDGQALSHIAASIVDTFCFSTDLICKGEPIVTAAHLQYGSDATPAAQFVQAHVTV